MSISYGWEKLHLAIHSLTGNGTQVERLLEAVTFNLSSITAENDLPTELQREFLDLMDSFRQLEPTGDEGVFAATINTLGEMERRAAIHSIISLYDKVCGHNN